MFVYSDSCEYFSQGQLFLTAFGFHAAGSSMFVLGDSVSDILVKISIVNGKRALSIHASDCSNLSIYIFIS